jgi:hypothetical protein
MPTFAIESNGRLEKTAVYYNGEQIAGLREIFIDIDEDGAFNTIIQYEGGDKEVYTKNIFADYLDNVKTVQPSFTEEDASTLNLFIIESEGDLENTWLYWNDEEEELQGVVSLFIHIKATENKSGIGSLFKKKDVTDRPEFKAQLTFRNEDDSLETEDIF